MIARQSLVPQYLSTLDNAVPGIALLTNDKENSLVIQCVEPTVVSVGSVHDDNAIGWQVQRAPNSDIVAFAFADRQKGRQQTVMVEADVQLDGSLGGTEFGPGKHRQTQVNGRGIEGVEFVLEAKTMPRCEALAAGQQLVEQRLVERIGLILVHPGKRCAGNLTATQVVELGGLRRQVTDNVAKTGTTGELGQAQGHELRPPGHFAQLLALVMLICEGLEFMSRNQFQQLGEYRIMMCQGLSLPVFAVFGGTSIVSTCRDLGLFYSRFMGQQWIIHILGAPTHSWTNSF